MNGLSDETLEAIDDVIRELHRQIAKTISDLMLPVLNGAHVRRPDVVAAQLRRVAARLEEVA